MKRFFALLIALSVLLGALCACNPEPEPYPPAGGEGSNGENSGGSGGSGSGGSGSGGSGSGGSGSGGSGSGGSGSGGGGSSGGGSSGGGNRVEDGWDCVDFGGQEVRLCVSRHASYSFGFPAADIYTKGPDAAGSNEVAKEVLARNKYASEIINIKVVYDERNLYYDAVIDDVRNTVITTSKTSPDIYNNDLVSLTYSMISGYLWNVKHPGEGVSTYCDFTMDGWHEEFIKGCTFDQEKLYIFAGDYFIDMVRMAWVVYVNNDLMESSVSKLPTWCKSLDDFYAYVAAGFWDMDSLAQLSGAVYADGSGGIADVAEKTDTVVGLALEHNSSWAFSAASGVTLYYQNENYAPKVLQDISTFQQVANKFRDLQSAPGVYYEVETRAALECFLGGNFLFAVSFLGEAETMPMREFDFHKGIVPIPKWNSNEQDDYRTPVHEQAEVGCILTTARAFTAATALMQSFNEESEDVVHTYYEKGLKFKYNSDRNSQLMMDLVLESVGSPFGFCIGYHCENLYTGTGVLKGMYITDPALSSTFLSEKDAYNDCMASMLMHFETLE